MDRAASIKSAEIELNSAEARFKRYIKSNFKSATVHDFLIARIDRASQNLRRAKSPDVRGLQLAWSEGDDGFRDTGTGQRVSDAEVTRRIELRANTSG